MQVKYLKTGIESETQRRCKNILSGSSSFALVLSVFVDAGTAGGQVQVLLDPEFHKQNVSTKSEITQAIIEALSDGNKA